MLVPISSLLVFLFISWNSTYAAVFNIESGDVAGLIAAMNAGNLNGEENTINLAPGIYKLTSVDNANMGNNGLPNITGDITIHGDNAETTIIERDPGAADVFRILAIGLFGTLRLTGVTLRGGVGEQVGGAIYNEGNLIIDHSDLRDSFLRSCCNRSQGGGAIWNGGTATVIHSSLTGNGASAGGAIWNKGTLNVVHSIVSQNDASDVGGGIANFLSGTAYVSGSTLGSNGVQGGGGGIYNAGAVTVDHSVIEENRYPRYAGDTGGGILNEGKLNVNYSTIRNNDVEFEGGGIANYGTLVLFQTIVIDNHAGELGGGVFNSSLREGDNSGVISIVSSSILHNQSHAGAGLWNAPGTANIQNSSISDNVITFLGPGAGIYNSPGATMEISGSTIANNIGTNGDGGIVNYGTVAVANSTLSGNTQEVGFGARLLDILNRVGATVELQNTIVDHCSGPITSLGNNIVGDLTECSISLLPNDLTGDPALGAYLDDGAPGHGRFPLLSTSQAIDRGNSDACSSDPALVTDQLGAPRRGPCDIGAVEFYRMINDLLIAENLSTAFDSTPVLNAPAGTFTITADFTNTSNQPIAYRFAEVTELSGGNLLLNANGGPGGVGARVTTSGSNTVLLPGATETFEFLIGLQSPEPFTFLVNILGDSQLDNSFE